MPSVKIIVGGPEVSPQANRLLEGNSYIDFAVMQEGEETFVELTDGLFNCIKDYGIINGIGYRDLSSGKVHVNPLREGIKDLSVIPSPLIDHVHKMDHVITLAFESTRGCPFSCRYCMWGSRKTRSFSMDRIEKEIEYICRHKTHEVYVTDWDLFASKNRYVPFLSAVKKYNRKHKNYVTFYFEIHPNSVNENTIKAMADVPECIYSIGIQTINDRPLVLSGRKPLKLDELTKNIKLLKDINPQAMVSLDLIFGLPGETYKSYRRSLDYGLRLGVFQVRSYPLQVLTGSEFDKKGSDYKLTFSETVPRYVVKSEWYSEEEMKYTAQLSKVVVILNRFSFLNNSLVELLSRNYLLDEENCELLEIYEDFIGFINLAETGSRSDWSFFGWEFYGGYEEEIYWNLCEDEKLVGKLKGFIHDFCQYRQHGSRGSERERNT